MDELHGPPRRGERHNKYYLAYPGGRTYCLDQWFDRPWSAIEYLDEYCLKSL